MQIADGRKGNERYAARLPASHLATFEASQCAQEHEQSDRLDAVLLSGCELLLALSGTSGRAIDWPVGASRRK